MEISKKELRQNSAVPPARGFEVCSRHCLKWVSRRCRFRPEDIGAGLAESEDPSQLALLYEGIGRSDALLVVLERLPIIGNYWRSRQWC